MALLWSYNSQYDATGSIYGSVHILVIHFCVILVLPTSKERNPVRVGGFQAATFFFVMQTTVDMIDAMNLMQPIKKDGRSQKGLSFGKVSCRTSPPAPPQKYTKFLSGGEGIVCPHTPLSRAWRKRLYSLSFSNCEKCISVLKR